MTAVQDWLSIAGALFRTGIAALLLVICLRDWPVTEAHAEFEALPAYDHLAQARNLAGQRRYSEALLVLEDGMPVVRPLKRVELADLHYQVERERASLLNRLHQAGEGLLTGTGESAEALAGAVVADLFVFGDVRDLVIQGHSYAQGEGADEVIVALSVAGIVLTATPSLDLGTALLKFARRVGALTEAFAASLVHIAQRAVAERRADELTAVIGDVAALGSDARPAVTLAVLKNLDEVSDLRRAAELSRRPGGSFALWVGGRSGLQWLRQTGSAGETLWLRAAKKGRVGMDWLAQKGTVLLRPHPLLGLLKGLYKDNVQALLGEWLRRNAAAFVGVFAAWLAFEALRFAYCVRERWRRVGG